MKKKVINSILTKVHKELTESITDAKVKELVKNNSIITGGSIVSLLTNEPVNDYDFYFTNRETVLAVTKYYVELFNKSHKINAEIKEEDERIKIYIKSVGVAGDDETEPNMESYENAMETNITPESDIENIPEKPKYQPVYLTSNAITLSGKVQLVIRFWGNAEEIHKNYDFIHCTNYWESSTKKVVLNQQALESILNKELIYSGSKYPLCSLIRTRKFIKRGWNINAGQYLKMAMQLNELNLTDVKILEDQLVGVDSGYFSMLINILTTKQSEDSTFKLNTNYVAEIIDKIF